MKTLNSCILEGFWAYRTPKLLYQNLRKHLPGLDRSVSISLNRKNVIDEVVGKHKATHRLRWVGCLISKYSRDRTRTCDLRVMRKPYLINQRFLLLIIVCQLIT